MTIRDLRDLLINVFFRLLFSCIWLTIPETGFGQSYSIITQKYNYDLNSDTLLSVDTTVEKFNISGLKIYNYESRHPNNIFILKNQTIDSSEEKIIRKHFEEKNPLEYQIHTIFKDDSIIMVSFNNFDTTSLKAVYLKKNKWIRIYTRYKGYDGIYNPQDKENGYTDTKIKHTLLSIKLYTMSSNPDNVRKQIINKLSGNRKLYSYNSKSHKWSLYWKHVKRHTLAGNHIVIDKTYHSKKKKNIKKEYITKIDNKTRIIELYERLPDKSYRILKKELITYN